MKYVQFGNLTIVPFAENLEVSISYEFLFKLGFFFLKKKSNILGKRGCLLKKSNGI